MKTTSKTWLNLATITKKKHRATKRNRDEKKENSDVSKHVIAQTEKNQIKFGGTFNFSMFKICVRFVFRVSANFRINNEKKQR